MPGLGLGVSLSAVHMGGGAAASFPLLPYSAGIDSLHSTKRLLPTQPGDVFTLRHSVTGAIETFSYSELYDGQDLSGWLSSAQTYTGSTDYVVFINPSTTDRIGFGIKVKNAGDKVRIWFDGEVVDYEDIDAGDATTGDEYIITKQWSTAAPRAIVVVGNISYFKSTGETKYGGSTSCYFGGDVTNLTSLTYLSWGGSNTGTGDVTNLTSLTVLNWYGSNTGTGDVTNLTSLAYLSWGGSNTGTGFAACALSATGLCYLNLGSSITLTETEVDGILSGFWTNRDAAKSRSERTIEINETNHAAPSAAGLLIKSDLQAYRSPNNDPTKSRWTVNTN